MTPRHEFLGQPPVFWAFVRFLSEQIGYYDADEVERGVRITKDRIRESLDTVRVRLTLKRIPDFSHHTALQFDEQKGEIVHHGPCTTEDAVALRRLAPDRKGWCRAIDTLEKRSRNRAWVSVDDLFEGDAATSLCKKLVRYLNFRRDVLRRLPRQFMDKDSAKQEYEQLKQRFGSDRPPTMNKQGGAKKVPAYLTAMINMLLDRAFGREGFDSDPQKLIKIVRGDELLGVLSRRLDGAFPSLVRAVAVWEIKEYYHTTTFGSRIADGVYEALLDGMELHKIFEGDKARVRNYLMIDGLETWWSSGGRPYLCRIIDACTWVS